MTTSLFDISADLDTPVSAYLKLKPFRPRFLLESVEGGERLARYSFIGFGDSLEFRLDASGLKLGAERLPRPADQAELLSVLRRALAAAPRPEAGDAAFPLHGGLVGVASYDLVRYFERLPSLARTDDDSPEAHYIAPRSLLVFDHLTRRAALLHAGPSTSARACVARSSARCAAACRARRGRRVSAHRRPACRRPSTWRAWPVRRSTSPPATSTSSCCPCVSRAVATSTRSRRIARSAC